MKRFFAVFLVLFLVAPCVFAESVDLSGLSFADLAALRDRCQMEMMARDEWQEVTVPVGVWEIGKDIPAGHWNITTSKESEYGWSSIHYSDLLDESGQQAKRGGKIYYYKQVKYEGSIAAVEATNIDIELKTGTYLIIEYGAVVFTPYTGKPDLGFK